MSSQRDTPAVSALSSPGRRGDKKSLVDVQLEFCRTGTGSEGSEQRWTADGMGESRPGKRNERLDEGTVDKSRTEGNLGRRTT